MAVVVDIVDTAFMHAPGMSWYNKPDIIIWRRAYPFRTKIRFFTDRNIGRVDSFPSDINVALLIEPICYDDTGYKICLNKLDKIHYVLSYDEEFLAKVGSKGLSYFIGGCWISESDRSLHPKRSLISMIASAKTATRGHQLRHEAARMLGKKIDILGHGYKPLTYKIEGLSHYRFSIAIENGIVDTLFTEKIIDCFMTGTVPIYYGTYKISEHFNMDGVIQFRNLEELDHIVSELSEEDYSKRTMAILDNFQRAKKYTVAENWIFRKYPFLMP